MKSLVKKPNPWNEKPCPYCGGKVIYTDNSRIYHGRTYGNGKCFVCINCGASVGVHGDCPPSHKPLGLLATPQMKHLKMSCHNLFDRVWKRHLKSRGECYRILAKKMGIPVKQCHFGWFNETDLKRAIKILRNKDWWQKNER